MTAGELSATIYGARGSLPNPSLSTRKYGGATTCLGIETPDLIPIVIDGGSGVFDLGLDFLSRGGPREVHMFFTHTHWDHLQGLPFFAPFYDPAWTVHIYSLGERRASVSDIYSGVYAQRFFPVPFDHLDADIRFHELVFDEAVTIGNTTVASVRVNHPGYALGFRVDHGGRSLFIASDAAPYTDILFEDRFHHRKRDTDPRVRAKMQHLQRRVDTIINGVDVLFHDANFTDKEYQRFFDYGHSSMTHAYELAQRCEVKRVVFWHHDRRRSDEEVEAIVAPYVERGHQEGLVVEPARQGTTYHLELGSDTVKTVHRDV